jgi:hypothetical protein
MRTQLTGNSISVTVSGLAGAAALLTVLGLAAAARANPLSEPPLAGPAADAQRVWSELEVGFRADLPARASSYLPDFGTAGLTVTGPLAAEDGESSGMVLRWSAGGRDPAYLVSATSLFSANAPSWIAADKSPRALPNFGIVPGGNLSVFETGAVDVVSWNFLEFSCAVLALRLEDYARLKGVLAPEDLESNSRRSGMGQQIQPVPDPATSLLMGQGLLILGLLVRASPRGPRAGSGSGQGSRVGAEKGAAPRSIAEDLPAHQRLEAGKEGD